MKRLILKILGLGCLLSIALLIAAGIMNYFYPIKVIQIIRQEHNDFINKYAKSGENVSLLPVQYQPFWRIEKSQAASIIRNRSFFGEVELTLKKMESADQIFINESLSYVAVIFFCDANERVIEGATLRSAF